MRSPGPASPAASTGTAADGFVARAGAAAGTARGAFGVAAQAAGMAGVAVALPWQTVYGTQQADIGAFVSAAALPAAQTAVRASLKRPGFAMAITTTLDLAVAGVAAGPGALVAAVPRFLLGGATSLFSLVTGSRGGSLRQLTGAVSAVTAVVQLGFTGWVLIGGMSGGAPSLTLLPRVVAMASSLVVAVKTTIVAFRRT